MIEAIIERLTAGEAIYMQLSDAGQRQWWMESPRLDVDNDVMVAIFARMKLVEAGDSLFGMKMNSQTWKLRGKKDSNGKRSRPKRKA